MFQVKICGVISAEDAGVAVDAGADAVGLNFYRASPRFVTGRGARQILKALPPGVARVGVFVNASSAAVVRTARELALDFVQLHGEEPPDFLDQLAGLPVIKAFRCPAGLAGVADYLNACHRQPAAVLLDAFHAHLLGGTGKLANWTAIRDDLALVGAMPIVLAGGLTAENVSAAIAMVRPTGVDTASGVERSPGRKDPQATRRFVAAARAALAAR